MIVGNNTLAAGVGTPWDPRRLNPIAWYRADLGITLAATEMDRRSTTGPEKRRTSPAPGPVAKKASR